MNQFALILSALCLASAATIHQPPEVFLQARAARVQTNRYYAVFPSPAGTQQAQQEQASFISQASALNVDFKERRRFNTLVNVVSFEVPAEKADQVAALPGVQSVFPLVTSAPPRVITKTVKDPELRSAHGMTGVSEAHSKLGLTGKGIKVGVIDSGIDYMHPALGGCLGKECKVKGGHDFVGDNYNGANEPVPDDDPRDCTNGGGGHGTHVSGIIAARDKDFVGAAPDASLYGYRVFGCQGSTSDEVILAAIEQAYKDGMDIINMSLGGTSSWADYPSCRAIDSLVERGLTVVMSAGNDGAKGLYQQQEPALSRRGMAIASFDNIKYYAYGMSVDGEAFSADYSSGDEKLVLKFEKTPIASAGNGKDDLACTALPDTVDLKGKLALVQRGVCTFVEKAKITQAAGAIGVLVYNKEAGAFTPAVSDPAVKIPLVGITRKTGLALLEFLAKKPVTITFDSQQKAYDNPTGGKVSGFSNWGPGPELEIKPEFGGPGGLIYSTYPLAKGGYATLSGTSMSTPYVTGTIALYMQAKGKTNPQHYRQVFQNTAVPTNTLGFTLPHPVYQQGSGMIDIVAALKTPTLVSPTNLAFNSTDVPTGKMKPITLTNSGRSPVTYVLSHQPALTVLPWSDKTGELLPVPVLKELSARIEISTKEVTIQPGQSARVNIFYNPPSGASLAERAHISGYIIADHKLSYADLLSGAKRLPTLRVPYAAIHADYKKLDILSRPDSGFPVLASNKTASKADPGQVFSLKDDVPNLMVRIIHPTKHLKVSVVDVAAGKTLGQISNGDYKLLGQHDQAPENLKMDIVWSTGQYVQDGKLVDVKDGGKYKLKVEALRPFGDEKNPASWQTWESVEFGIDRKAPAKDGARLDDGAPLEALDRLKRAARQWLAARDKLDESVLPTPNRVPVQAQ